MLNFHSTKMKALAVSAALLSSLLFLTTSLRAQSGALQQRVGELKDSIAKNKLALAQYTWTEQLTIILKGQTKKTEHFQVRIGPDGKQQKTSLDSPPQAAPAPHGRLRQRIVEEKKEEYKDYADQMKALAQQYIPPDKDAIQSAYSKGNASFSPGSGVPGDISIVIKNYVKPNDSMTIVFNKDRKQISAIRIASYMDDPTDAMNLSVEFADLPDGTSHVSSVVIEGVRKQLTIQTQNSNYRKL
ncbi:MAG TPA: hypothetical protein VMJ93_13270 [Verrucomicrobiae bacterium]|nr:hypothetical protein [Verrucomicrobiae bacterium]